MKQCRGHRKPGAHSGVRLYHDPRLPKPPRARRTNNKVSVDEMVERVKESLIRRRPRVVTRERFIGGRVPIGIVDQAFKKLTSEGWIESRHNTFCRDVHEWTPKIFDVRLDNIPEDTSSVQSPCNNKCKMDRSTGICTGCKRTRGEIARWRNMTDEQKREVLEKIKTR